MENKGQFKKTIGLPQVIALNIGAVLGSGVLLVPGIAAQMAGPSSLLAWGLMTLFVFPMALVMGLLAAKYPSAGGVSTFVTNAFGQKAGSLIGWFFLMSVPIGAPVIALTGSGYISAAFGFSPSVRIMIAIAMLLVGLILNLLGMKLAGSIQVAVVIGIVAVLILTIFGSVPNIHAVNFEPLIPTTGSGWISVGQSASILFWCYIGWEAISHLSAEFKNPQREAIRGVTYSAFLVGALYFFTAFATVGTKSYGGAGSEVSLVLVVNQILGHGGAIVIGITAIFICLATIIAYVGAASRLAYSLASSGDAPKVLGILSKKYNTPLGGLGFLSCCFVVIITLYATGTVPLSTIVQLPNATFILVYLGGCAAGIKLLKGTRGGVAISWVSFLLTAAVFPFVGWVVAYPLIIIAVYFLVKGTRKKAVLGDAEIQSSGN
jgi:amino acid efflux transporter